MTKLEFDSSKLVKFLGNASNESNESSRNMYTYIAVQTFKYKASCLIRYSTNLG